MKDQLEVIRSNSNNLTTLAGDLDTGLNETKANLADIQNNCSSLPGPPAFCNRVDPTNLASDADFTNLPNVTEQLQNVQGVVDQDFEKTAQEVDNNSLLNPLTPDIKGHTFASKGEKLLKYQENSPGMIMFLNSHDLRV